VSTERSSLVRQYSRRLVAEILLREAPISRTDLARITGLSKQTMSQVIGELEAEGWVRLVGTSKGAVGRAAVTYEIAYDAAYSVGVDLGGAKLTAAVADLLGRIVTEETEPVEPRGGQYVLEQIHAFAMRLAAAKAIDPRRIGSVVVGTPGVIDPKSGRIALAPNIKRLSEVNVAQILGQLFGQDVVVENDVNLAMLGEAWLGCAQGVENAGFMALDTGVGFGLIANGKLVRGATGAAGEIAYLPLGRDTTSAEALDVGSFELEVGSLGIVRRYRARGGRQAATVRDIFALAERGDPHAAAVLDETAHIVALAVVSLQATIDAECVVLGGSIGRRPELVQRVQQAVGKLFARPVRILTSGLGSRAGLVGAVSSAVQRLHNRRFGIADLPGELAIPGPKLARAAE
jgi:predicted NBD/HSP70 family sugar kinase